MSSLGTLNYISTWLLVPMQNGPQTFISREVVATRSTQQQTPWNENLKNKGKNTRNGGGREGEGF